MEAAQSLRTLGQDWASHTGTYIGCMFVDHFALLRDGYGMGSSGPVMTGNGAPYQAGRVAYAYGLRGGAAGLDTACSSSLVAVHSAHCGMIGVESLELGAHLGSGCIVFGRNSLVADCLFRSGRQSYRSLAWISGFNATSSLRCLSQVSV